MENPIKIDDLGVSLFQETSICQLTKATGQVLGVPESHKRWPCHYLALAMDLVTNANTLHKTHEIAPPSLAILSLSTRFMQSILTNRI
jgi:hypothetical protein